MWAQLLRSLPQLFQGVSGASSGLSGLTNVGQNAQGVMGDQGLSLMGGTQPSALDSLGSGLAPNLGGAPAAPNPLAGLGASGGLMDYQQLPSTGGKNASKYENEQVQGFVNAGLNAPEIPDNGFGSLMMLMQQLGGRNG